MNPTTQKELETKKREFIKKALPVLNGLTVNQALEVIEHAKGYFCDFAAVSIRAPSPKEPVYIGR